LVTPAVELEPGHGPVLTQGLDDERHAERLPAQQGDGPLGAPHRLDDARQPHAARIAPSRAVASSALATPYPRSGRGERQAVGSGADASRPDPVLLLDPGRRRDRFQQRDVSYDQP